jgi:glyoxylase-like metal-dependent hydrolase (beta-lactamase superfamily II)
MSFQPPHQAPSRLFNLPDLWQFNDCCNVHVLQQGDRAVLIDLGSAAVLDHLEGMGVREVEAVYFTHAHRDQCQGAARALKAGIPLHFPREARNFVAAEWRSDLKPPSPLVRAYPGRFDPPRPLPPGTEEIFFDVGNGQRISFGEMDLEVQAAPGHIDHQVAYLLDWEGRRLCFSGDAIHSHGKLHEPYHWETDHYTGAGLRVGRDTLRVLRHHRPDALLPSHGPVAEGDLWTVLDETEMEMRELAELKDTIVPGRPAVPRLARPVQNRLQQVSPHLYVWNNSYFLLSDEGPVLMVDNAGPLPEPFWEQYRAQIGVRPIEVILVTHIHCDHVEGIEYLRQQDWSGEVWAQAEISDCLEAPHRFRRPYLSEWPVRVDRRLAEGERFRFHEHEMIAHYAPGQTDLHACYEITIDGRRAIISGDNFYPVQQWGGTGGLCGLNGGHPDRWRRTIDLYLQLAPEWVLASHIHPFVFRRDDFLAMRQWCDDVSAAMRKIAALDYPRTRQHGIPDGNLERHHVPLTFSLEPYAQEVRPGELFQVTGAFHNSYDHPVEFSARLIVPEGWEATPPDRQGTIPPGEVGSPIWEVRAGSGPDAALLTADLVYDGLYLGEKAECYVYLSSSTNSVGSSG